ncbi:MAG: sugar phosphate isomerase/epimerase [Firmicutes bacterium]|nr:sugar phosphate isomerase/epimerase [Bacillota bacterium]
MKLSFSTLACPDWDIKKVVKFAVDNKYDGVELRGNPPHISKEYSQIERESVRDLFHSNGLEIPCITAYTRFNERKAELRRENIEELKEIIELAADLGAPYVRTFGSDADNSYELSKVISWIAEAFKEIDDYAAQKGVRVLLETHDFLSKGEDVVKIFEKSQTSNCGVLWDVAHSIRAGEDIATTLAYLGRCIYHIHLKDWVPIPVYSRDHYVLIAAGSLPLRALLERLKTINYQGYLSLEWEKVWHPEIEESDIAVVQYALKMREYLNDLNKPDSY